MVVVTCNCFQTSKKSVKCSDMNVNFCLAQVCNFWCSFKVWSVFLYWQPIPRAKICARTDATSLTTELLLHLRRHTFHRLAGENDIIMNFLPKGITSKIPENQREKYNLYIFLFSNGSFLLRRFCFSASTFSVDAEKYKVEQVWQPDFQYQL